jgi:hypothetical protein
MQTIRGQVNMINTSLSGIKSSISQVPDSSNQAKRLKISEFISWSVCFAVISGITGLIKYLKVGVTMDTVTSILFYSSLAGMVYFISRVISLSKNPVQLNRNLSHELN